VKSTTSPCTPERFAPRRLAYSMCVSTIRAPLRSAPCSVHRVSSSSSADRSLRRRSAPARSSPSSQRFASLRCSAPASLGLYAATKMPGPASPPSSAIAVMGSSVRWARGPASQLGSNGTIDPEGRSSNLEDFGRSPCGSFRTLMLGTSNYLGATPSGRRTVRPEGVSVKD
jgi:hypothetical protein